MQELKISGEDNACQVKENGVSPHPILGSLMGLASHKGYSHTKILKGINTDEFWGRLFQVEGPAGTKVSRWRCACLR